MLEANKKNWNKNNTNVFLLIHLFKTVTLCINKDHFWSFYANLQFSTDFQKKCSSINSIRSVV